jgi:7-cyano-7-deazaguanine synthase
MYKVTVLLSGGIDSSVLLAWCKNQEIECQPLFFDYGQVTASRELNAAEKISKKMGFALEKVTISNVSSLTKNQITDPSQSTSPFYPNRNLLLLTLGSMHAYENKNQGVGIGAIRAVNSTPFPDMSHTFFDEFTKLVETSLNYKLAILVPFIDLTKTEVVKIGRNLQVPLELTYSCLTTSDRPCGSCESCISRKEAMGE